MRYRTMVLLLGWGMTGFYAKAEGPIALAMAGKATCAIVSSSEPRSKLAAVKLADYLAEHTGAKPAILAEADISAPSPMNLIVIDGSADHHLTTKLGVPIDIPGERMDAYHLRVVPQEKRALILVAGRSGVGAKYGAYRLIDELELTRDSATVSNLDITASPEIKGRSLSAKLTRLEDSPEETDGSRRLGFLTYDAENLVETDSTFALTGRGKLPAIALLKLPAPLQHQAQFHFHCQVSKSGKYQNAGFVLGLTSSVADLIRCEAHIRGRDLQISGPKILQPVKIDLAQMDPKKPLDITVSVNLDEHHIHFQVGEHAAEADLDHDLREVRYYGYAVTRTTSRFSPIEVKEIE